MLRMRGIADLGDEVAHLTPERRAAFLNECIARASAAEQAAARTPTMRYWASLIGHGYPLDALPAGYRRHMTPREIMSHCVVVAADLGHPRIPWPQGAADEEAWQAMRLRAIRAERTASGL